jgi:hypothetical protein
MGERLEFVAERRDHILTGSAWHLSELPVTGFSTDRIVSPTLAIRTAREQWSRRRP